MTLPSTELRCRAPGRSPGMTCNGMFGRWPGRYVLVGHFARMPEEPDGLAWLRCKDCGRWSCWRIVPLVEIPQPTEGTRC